MRNGQVRNIVHAITQWGPEAIGSTRAAGLMRMGLGAIALIRFGKELAPYAINGLIGLSLTVLFFSFAFTTILGIRARLSVAGLGAMIMLFYAFGLNGIGLVTWAHHHVYLLGMACLLLSLSDCGKSFSVDRLRAMATEDRARPPAEFGSLLGQRLIALQLSALYFWTAVDKSDWAFVSGQRLEQTMTWVHSGRALEFVLHWPALLALASIIVLVVEYWLAVAILMSRWRQAAILVGLTMHISFYLLLPVNTYSITVIVLYLALLDPAAVHRFIDCMLGYPEVAR